MSTSSILEVSFHRTAEGFPAALVEDRPFVAMPNGQGVYSIWSAYSNDRPPAEWTRRDFYIASGTVANEEAFRTHVMKIADHRRELRSLDRPEIRPGSSTPWGAAQVSRRYADGIVEHSTAGHGGLELDAATNAKVPALYRNPDGFYEEDGEWSKVAATFPHLFTAYERKCADEALRNTEPDAYESVNGVVLQPGQSRAKDARRFQSDHAAEWVAIRRSTRLPTPASSSVWGLAAATARPPNAGASSCRRPNMNPNPSAS